jgi:large subunit ribosomal protein L18e
MHKKTDPVLKDTIMAALKTKSAAWHVVAQRLSAATRRYDSRNLGEIDAETMAGDTVIVLGKVLSGGEVTKKVRIGALGFSQSARDKLKKTKSEAVSISEEIARNQKATGVKFL